MVKDVSVALVIAGNVSEPAQATMQVPAVDNITVQLLPILSVEAAGSVMVSPLVPTTTVP
jgi:hypothetical protein